MSGKLPTLTVLIITFNEENNIRDCIESARLLTDEIIHIDTSSTDKTVKIASVCGIKSYTVPHLGIVEPIRNAAIKKVKTDWFFLLDADERITTALKADIESKIQNTTATHFQMPRKNIFAKKKWLRYGGWYPDIVTRLIKTDSFKSWPSEIHSRPIIVGDKGVLDEALIHFFHSDITEMVQKTINYEQKVAQLLFEAKRSVKIFTFFRKFLAEFLRRYIQKLGILDGKFGLLESIYQAYSQTITWLFLWEKYEREKLSKAK